jgi:hypothetical protein
MSHARLLTVFDLDLFATRSEMPLDQPIPIDTRSLFVRCPTVSCRWTTGLTGSHRCIEGREELGRVLLRARSVIVQPFHSR